MVVHINPTVTNVSKLRRNMRNTLPRHGQQLHMYKENNVSRKRALSFVAKLDLKVTVVSNYRVRVVLRPIRLKLIQAVQMAGNRH